MTNRLTLGFATALALVLTQVAAARPAPKVAAAPLKLEKVVMLMRHGIRPPTKALPVPVKYGSDPWPQWGVEPGPTESSPNAKIGRASC